MRVVLEHQQRIDADEADGQHSADEARHPVSRSTSGYTIDFGRQAVIYLQFGRLQHADPAGRRTHLREPVAYHHGSEPVFADLAARDAYLDLLARTPGPEAAGTRLAILGLAGLPAHPAFLVLTRWLDYRFWTPAGSPVDSYAWWAKQFGWPSAGKLHHWVRGARDPNKRNRAFSEMDLVAGVRPAFGHWSDADPYLAAAAATRIGWPDLLPNVSKADVRVLRLAREGRLRLREGPDRADRQAGLLLRCTLLPWRHNDPDTGPLHRSPPLDVVHAGC